MLKKWIKKIAIQAMREEGKTILEEVLQERADQVQKVTQALLEGNSKDCKHPSYGKWKETLRTKASLPHRNNVGEIIMMERVCNHCGYIESQRIANPYFSDVKL